jgi:hypothetical protein
MIVLPALGKRCARHAAAETGKDAWRNVNGAGRDRLAKPARGCSIGVVSGDLAAPRLLVKPPARRPTVGRAARATPRRRAQCWVASSSGPTSSRSAGSSLSCVSSSANTISHAPENMVNGRYQRRIGISPTPLFGQECHYGSSPRRQRNTPDRAAATQKAYTTKLAPWLRNCHNLQQTQHRYWAKSCCTAAGIGAPKSFRGK